MRARAHPHVLDRSQILSLEGQVALAVGAGRIVLVDEVDAPEVGIAGEAGFGEAAKQGARYDAARREGGASGLTAARERLCYA
jgi:hypothetical protein